MSLLKYYENDLLTFDVNNHNFINVMGSGNKKIVDNLLFKNKKSFVFINGEKINKKNYNKYRNNVSFVINSNLNLFTSETVEDELAYGMENLVVKNSLMHEKIEKYAVLFGLNNSLRKDPFSLGSSTRCVIKILSSLLCEPKILVLDNVLCELDREDKEKIINVLINFVKEGNSVINFTSDVEDTLYGNYIILNDKTRVIATGRTMQILNEEKLMNKLGLSLPFIVNLNKQLMYYELIDDYIIDEKKLVDKIWK